MALLLPPSAPKPDSAPNTDSKRSGFRGLVLAHPWLTAGLAAQPALFVITLIVTLFTSGGEPEAAPDDSPRASQGYIYFNKDMWVRATSTGACENKPCAEFEIISEFCLDPIVTADGVTSDGRNRWQSKIQIDIDYTKLDEPTLFVVEVGDPMTESVRIVNVICPH